VLELASQIYPNAGKGHRHHGVGGWDAMETVRLEGRCMWRRGAARSMEEERR